MENEKQINMFDEVKIEPTEKKYQPLYNLEKKEESATPKKKKALAAILPEAKTEEIVEEMAEEVQEAVSVSPATQEKDFTEEEIYDEKMYEGVDGALYPESEWFAPIVEEGPTRQEVEDWKRKYKRIYFLPFDDGIYIFRTLKRPEYKEIVRNSELSSLDREESFAERCILFPRDFTIAEANNGDAGIVSVLSDAIMEKSGFMAKTGIIKL